MMQFIAQFLVEFEYDRLECDKFHTLVQENITCSNFRK